VGVTGKMIAKRRNFNKKNIRAYWATTTIWYNKFDSSEEFLLEEQTCFACGFIPLRFSFRINALLERAHIEALWRGGETR
jgi:hypothetical protein